MRLPFSVQVGRAVGGVVAGFKAATSWTWRGGYSSGGGFGGQKFNGAGAYPSLWNLDHNALRAAARAAEWDSPEAHGIHHRITESAVNWGLMLEPSPVWSIIDPKNEITAEARRAKVQEVEALFGLWMDSTDLDASGRKTGYQLQGFTFINRAREGEVIVLCRYSSDASLLNPLQLQFVNPDQVKNPIDATQVEAAKARGNRIVDGIEIDDAGKEIAIYIWDDIWSGPFAPSPTYRCTRIPKNGGKSNRPFFLHPLIADAIGMVRGIPLIAHVIHELKKLTDYSIAELEAAVINGIFAAWIEPSPQAAASKALSGITKRTAIQLQDDAADGKAPMGIVNKPGIVVQTLKAGEKFNSFDTKRPNVNYPAFHDKVYGNISTSLGIPLSMAKMAFTSNFGANKGELRMGWNTIEMMRFDFASEYLDQIYAAAMDEWVKSSTVELKGWDVPKIRRAWLKCEWIGINAPSIQPTDDAKAADLRIAAGHSTRARESRLYNGSDFEENVARLTEENVALAEANKPLAPPAPFKVPGASSDMPAPGSGADGSADQGSGNGQQDGQGGGGQ